MSNEIKIKPSCTCGGKNPNCFKCDGRGYITQEQHESLQKQIIRKYNSKIVCTKVIPKRKHKQEIKQLMTICPICMVQVRVDRIDNHIKKVHNKGDVVQVNSIKGKLSSSLKNNEPENINILYLKSKRGLRIEELEQCDECKMGTKPVWRYSESNKGVIFLCSSCKPLVLERSFGKVDALNTAFSGGKFEGNRRKH